MAKTSPFGAWLFKWRKARSLTQIQLAQKAHCAQSVISMYERGARSEVGAEFMRPEPDLVERLATALSRPVEEARLLAGYSASPAPVTLQTVQEALKEGKTVVITEANADAPLVLTTLSPESVSKIAQELVQELSKYFLPQQASHTKK